MRTLSPSEQQVVAGGCNRKCLPVDRRPVTPLPRYRDPTGNNGGLIVPPPPRPIEPFFDERY